MIDPQHQSGEIVASATSYTLGAGMIYLSLSDLSHMAQQIAIILGCVVVAIRVVHDAVGLYRRIKRKD